MTANYNLLALFMLFCQVPTDFGSPFDYLAVVVEWGYIDYTQFTMHGLWPNFYNGSYPEDCPGQAFNAGQIETLNASLNSFWIDNEGDNPWLWSHEWTKHGTCTGYSEYGYFQNAINGFIPSVNSIWGVWLNAGITPSLSTTYSSTTLSSYVQSALGQQAVLSCSGSTLDLIYICFQPNMTKMDCPSSVASACYGTITWPCGASSSATTCTNPPIYSNLTTSNVSSSTSSGMVTTSGQDHQNGGDNTKSAASFATPSEITTALISYIGLTYLL